VLETDDIPPWNLQEESQLGYFQAFLQCPEGKKKGSVALVHRPSGSRGNRVPAFCKLHRSVVIMQRCQWETRTGPQGLLCACSLPEGNKNHQIPVRGKKYKCVPHETIRHGKMRTQCRRSSWLRADPKRQAALWFGAVGRALRLSFAFFGAAFFPRFARSLSSRSKKKQPKKLGHTEARLGNANKNAIGAKTVCLLKGAHEEGGLRRSHGPSRQIRSLQRRQKNLLSLLFWRARTHTHTHKFVWTDFASLLIYLTRREVKGFVKPHIPSDLVLRIVRTPNQQKRHDRSGSPKNPHTHSPLFSRLPLHRWRQIVSNTTIDEELPHMEPFLSALFFFLFFVRLLITAAAYATSLYYAIVL
jgi:hypothetical protein